VKLDESESFLIGTGFREIFENASIDSKIKHFLRVETNILMISKVST